MLVRDAKREDVPLVFDSWMKSWRVSKYAGVISNNLFFSTTRANIEHLIARGATIKVACLESDPDCILGWVCFEHIDDNHCVHYVYVKDPYLTKGVGETLAAQLPESGFYSYRCSQMEDFFPKYRWVPEIARRK
jgi:hypothetical protein